MQRPRFIFLIILILAPVARGFNLFDYLGLSKDPESKPESPKLIQRKRLVMEERQQEAREHIKNLQMGVEGELECNNKLLPLFGMSGEFYGPLISNHQEKQYCPKNEMTCCTSENIDSIQKDFRHGVRQLRRRTDMLEELLTLFKGQKFMDAIKELENPKNNYCDHVFEGNTEKRLEFIEESNLMNNSEHVANMLVDLEAYIKKQQWFYGNFVCAICNPYNHKYFRLGRDNSSMVVHSHTCTELFEQKDFELKIAELYRDFINPYANLAKCLVDRNNTDDNPSPQQADEGEDGEKADENVKENEERNDDGKNEAEQEEQVRDENSQLFEVEDGENDHNNGFEDNNATVINNDERYINEEEQDPVKGENSQILKMEDKERVQNNESADINAVNEDIEENNLSDDEEEEQDQMKDASRQSLKMEDEGEYNDNEAEDRNPGNEDIDKNKMNAERQDPHNEYEQEAQVNENGDQPLLKKQDSPINSRDSFASNNEVGTHDNHQTRILAKDADDQGEANEANNGKAKLIENIDQQGIADLKAQIDTCFKNRYFELNEECAEHCRRSIVDNTFDLDIFEKVAEALKTIFNSLTEKDIEEYYSRVKNSDFNIENIKAGFPFFKINESQDNPLSAEFKWDINNDQGVAIFNNHISKKFIGSYPADMAGADF